MTGKNITVGERRKKEIQYLSKQRRPVSTEQLGAYFGVSRNTILMDLDVLRDLGYVFETRTGRGGGYRIREAPSTIGIVLNDAESKIWMELVEKADEEQKRIMIYVMGIAEAIVLSMAT